MIKSKRAISPTIIFLMVLALIIFVGLVVLGTGLVKGSGGQLSSLIPEQSITVADVSGDAEEGEKCVSSWDCEKGYACIENICAESLTYTIEASGAPTSKKGSCYESMSELKTAMDNGDAAVTPLEAGIYRFETMVGHKSEGGSGYIYPNYDDDKNDVTQIVYLWARTGDTGDNYYNLANTKLPFAQSGNFYFMRPGVIYELDATYNFRLYPWYYDTKCKDNAGSVTIRVDKIA